MVPSPNQFDTLHQRRCTFYDDLLTHAALGPEVDLDHITRAWLKPTDADWVWLWLKNTAGESKKWELVCDASADGRQVLPPRLSHPSGACLSDYCTRTGLPVRAAAGEVQDALTHDGQVYVQCLAEDLRALECSAYDVVPVRSPGHAPAIVPDVASLELDIEGVVCLHYRRRPADSLQHPPETLRLMGMLTAQSLINSYQFQQLAILVQLNELAANFLTRLGRPKDVRHQYLEKIIDLIKRFLHVDAVSIFYVEHFSPEAKCIATTGIGDAAGRQIKPSELWRASYPVNGDTWTGRCLRTGAPYIRPHGDEPAHAPRFIEMPGGTPMRHRALAMMPIPVLDGGPDDGRACGVIRCTGHTSPRYRGSDRNFDPIEVQALDFIATQISPVLKTFAAQIRREDTISIIKHDLYAPLNMIRDGLDRFEDSARSAATAAAAAGQTPRAYDLRNMQVAYHVAKGMVAQLDADPAATTDFRPRVVLLEGDIVARLKNLMEHFARQERRMTIKFNEFRGRTGPSSEIPPLYIDPVLTERVLSNLIGNAIKYGKEGTEIIVDPYVDETGVHIWVSNYGIGVDEDERELIFMPYYRSQVAKKTDRGVGLGLAIARDSMRAQGGDLRLVRLNDPTIFELFFPNKLIR